jgi:hypothetical protein
LGKLYRATTTNQKNKIVAIKIIAKKFVCTGIIRTFAEIITNKNGNKNNNK